MNVRVGLKWKLSTKELIFFNCGVGEDSCESLVAKEIQPVDPKGNQSECSLEKTLMLGKIAAGRRRVRQRIIWLNCITDSMDISLSKLKELEMDLEACCSPWGHKGLDTTKQLNWTDTYTIYSCFYPRSQRNKQTNKKCLSFSVSQFLFSSGIWELKA